MKMKKYDPKIHHRRSIRLKGYDYARPGYYFITLVTQYRLTLFGEIQNGEMILNEAGAMIKREWEAIPERFPTVTLHEFVIMPNHFHGILEIIGGHQNLNNDSVVDIPVETNSLDLPEPDVLDFPDPSDETSYSSGFPESSACKKSLGDIIGAFESIVTVEYIRGVKNLGWPPFRKKLWQRNYWEHIIRHDRAFANIVNYIRENPSNWGKDKFNS